MKRPLSPSDRRILRVVQRDGRITAAALAEQVGLAASPCLRRLKALEDDGIVEGYRARVSRKALGFDVEAFIFIKLEQSEPGWRTRLVDRLNTYEEVIACYALAGDVDLLVHAVAETIESFGEFTMNRLLTLPGVADVRSSFVLSAVKPPSPLPVRE
ncbi:Lrp/AsnC family transcriptional regulator [Salinarimonas soli]|uniref:Lrp/AsnC family transcriptional regulator n=1 Tax=Salinarimonas soli TaxID=1638099 RepID=A0A5B2V6N5_9HYPH|nr:Lrp/AsnC family transcriptional regulator [Salinarimonas soli]KAA2235183.1 Lrp/AsnC family transcriptional regulator [Salinarimonas soli]